METILITGANRGIGLELARQFLATGRRVIATCRQPDQASVLRALDHPDKLVMHPLDVTSAESVERLAALLAGQVVDVLINNAGIMGGERQSIEEMDYAAWDEAFQVNTLAPFRLITRLRENLRLAQRPRVVTLSSQMGSLQRQSKGAYAYRSSKAAVNKVMQVLSLELQEDRIVVCPVHPGWVRTDMGGSGADIAAEESAAGLLKLIDAMTMVHSGRFWTWQGEEHPW